MQMQAKFAKAIAENIATIAESTTRIVLIDARIGCSPDGFAVAEARVECYRDVQKAKANIASLLQQPGTWQS